MPNAILGLELTLPAGRGVAIYPPGATYGPRVMRDYEFVWLIEGDAEYHWGSESAAAPEGSIVLCRPGATDSFRWDQQRRTRHGFYHFDIRSLPPEWPRPERWPLVRVPHEGDVLRPLFRHLLTWAGKGSEALCRMTMAHMLTAFVCGEISSADFPRETLPDAVERAWKHIHRSLEDDAARPIHLAELAREACVTPEHLCRLFKSALGHSPVETVRLARLDRAAVLLARSNYSVGEIAALCGFASQFHFSRRFKEAFGKPPSQVREDVQSGGFHPPARLLRVALSVDARPRRLES